jgi:hypothetical protein
MNSFTNNEADKVAKAAYNLICYGHDRFKTEFRRIKNLSKDYIDTMEIACMIENNEVAEKIVSKIHKLSYDARESLPSSVFVKYNLENYNGN